MRQSGRTSTSSYSTIGLLVRDTVAAAAIVGNFLHVRARTCTAVPAHALLYFCILHAVGQWTLGKSAYNITVRVVLVRMAPHQQALPPVSCCLSVLELDRKEPAGISHQGQDRDKGRVLCLSLSPSRVGAGDLSQPHPGTPAIAGEAVEGSLPVAPPTRSTVAPGRSRSKYGERRLRDSKWLLADR
jgi:hypothetical protein